MPKAHLASILLALCLPLPVWADEAEDFAERLSQAVTAHTLAHAYLDACDAAYPESRSVRRDVMAGWSHRSGLADYERLLSGAGDAFPDLTAGVEAYRAQTREAVSEAIAADAAPCQDFAATLAEERFDIATAMRRLVRDADDFGIALPAPTPLALPALMEEAIPLAALWTRALEIMDAVGSKVGAEGNRDLREAREDYLLAWLEAHGTVQAIVRVIAEDELREWRGDQQSSLKLSCSGFASAEDRALMETSIGQDMLVAGEPKWVLEQAVGGVINLGNCQVAAAPAPSSPSLDDSAGLMLRPLEFDEAFAGPDQGIRLSEVDRVLYLADFTNRLDGFGNGYTDRQEDIYVLLRDGTAYRHDWAFAFTDLDTELSRYREPQLWFSWTEHGGKPVLLDSGGREIDLADAQLLAPLPDDQRLDQTYYYLNVGTGGVRRDREYAFAADGTVSYARSGLVAGNFGTSFIAVVPGEAAPSRLGYRFEDFTMIIDGPEGSERHFAAMIAGDDPNAPDELLIGGQAYWNREGQ